MSTVVAIEAPTGVAIAGDTRVAYDGTASSDRFQRVFDLRGVGIGVDGESAEVQEFWRSFETALRDRGLETGDAPGVDAVARITARETQKAGVNAVVGARDADGIARLRKVSADGRVIDDDAVALGGRNAVAFGVEALGAERAGNDPAAAVRNVLETMMERDVATGGEVDVWTLASADRIERGARDIEREEEAKQ